MLPVNKKISVLKKQHMEFELIQQHLDKVTKLNCCLVCEASFPDDLAIRRHFLNVHQKGVFVCNITGCNYVANTNGDLRMHCLIWHSEHFSMGKALPENPTAMTLTSNALTSVQMLVMTSAPKTATVTSGAKPTVTSDTELSVTVSNPMTIMTTIPKTSPAIPISEQLPKEKLPNRKQAAGQPLFTPIINNLQCSTCKHPFFTELGINMHQRYHRFNSFLPKLKKMSDIETIDELKQILDINDERSEPKGLTESKSPPHCITNKENAPVKNIIIEAKQPEPMEQQKQPPPQQKQQQKEQLQQQQKQQTQMKRQKMIHQPQQKIQHSAQQMQQWAAKKAEILSHTKVNITKNLQQFRTFADVKKIIDMVDNAKPTHQITTAARDSRKRSLSPAGSVVSISSDESVVMEHNGMDYSYDEVIDIEF